MKTVYESCIIDWKDLDGTRNLKKLSKLIFDRIIPLHLNIMKKILQIIEKNEPFM